MDPLVEFFPGIQYNGSNPSRSGLSASAAMAVRKRAPPVPAFLVEMRKRLQLGVRVCGLTQAQSAITQQKIKILRTTCFTDAVLTAVPETKPARLSTCGFVILPVKLQSHLHLPRLVGLARDFAELSVPTVALGPQNCG